MQIGFGGPETIVARSDVPDVTVANPFLFRYTPLDDDADSAFNSSAEQQLLGNGAQVGVCGSQATCVLYGCGNGQSGPSCTCFGVIDC